MSRLTDSLLGLSEGTVRAPNTYSLGRYLGVLFVILLGAVYALPNLFPPDFAIADPRRSGGCADVAGHRRRARRKR